jgi:AmmeMemoRadiSam system protein B
MAQHVFQDVRPSPIAGQWYPGNPDRLAKDIDAYLEKAPPITIAGHIAGLIVPHAGYVYSGPIAACAFRLVREMTFERVFVVSPMHHVYAHPILTSAHDAYSTPLGTIPVDREILEALEQHLPIRATRRDPEHSLEIELPFLQRVLKGAFKLVPLMLRDQTYEVAKMVGQAIVEVVGEDARSALLVASSDLSHFYTKAQAEKLDRVMLDQIEAFDPVAVIRVEDEGRAFACGRAAIAAVLVAARALGATHAQIVGYGTSADASGDTRRVVGYGAAAVYRAA